MMGHTPFSYYDKLLDRHKVSLSFLESCIRTFDEITACSRLHQAPQSYRQGSTGVSCYPRTGPNPPKLEGSRDPEHPEPLNDQGDQETTGPSFLALLLPFLHIRLLLLLGKPTLNQSIPTNIINEPEPRRTKLNTSIPSRNNNHNIPHIHQLHDM